MTNVELLIHVLISLPSEIDKRSMNKKPKLRENLTTTWCKTVWVLQRVFDTCITAVPDSKDDSLNQLALECCLVWLKLVNLPLDTITNLLPYFLSASERYSHDNDSRAWNMTQDCIIIVFNHPELIKRPQLLWQWLKNLIIIANNNNNSICYSDILTSVGDNYSRLLLSALIDNNESNKWTAENLIKILLDCAEYPGRYPIDEQKSNVPFSFWFTLQDDLSTFDPPLDNKIKESLKPIYARLSQALLYKAKLPIKQNEIGDDDERELFRCYRQDAADTMSYCYNVLGQDLLILIGQRLSQPQLQSQTWTDVESTLHAFQALSDSIGIQENNCVSAIMNLILSELPYNEYPKEVMACACTTIGAYAEWIGENPNPWLEHSLKLVTTSLTYGTITATPATMALKDISRECGPHLTPLAPAILDTISKTLVIITPGCNEGLRLMYAAGKLLNSLPSMEIQLKYLDVTLGLCVIKLHELLDKTIATARVDVVNQLKMSTMFLSTLEGAMGSSVLDGLLPIFKKIVNNNEWNQDDDVLGAMHICAQQTLQCLLHPEIEAKPLLPIIVVAYKNHPHPAALTLLRQVVLLFSRDPENIIGPIFADISAHSIGGFRTCKSIGGNLSELADLLEAFLGLLAQICKKSPKLMAHVGDQIPEMLQCAIAGLCLPENAVIKAASTFLTHAINRTTKLSSYIEVIGQELVCTILQCVEGGVVRSELEAHAKVLMALNNNCGYWTAQWLRVALSNSNLSTPGQKEDFVRDVLREKINSRRLFDTLQKYNHQCHRQVMGI